MSEPQTSEIVKSGRITIPKLLNQISPDSFNRRSEIFPTVESRQELYLTGKKISEYLYKEKIPNVIFLDRAARGGYLAMREYWLTQFPGLKKPHAYFMSPKGFRSQEYMLDYTVYGVPRIIDDRNVAFDKGETPESLHNVRTEEEIDKEAEKTYRRLLKDRDKPVLLFDTCVHTGEGVTPVFESLYRLGFEDMRFGVVSDSNNFSGIKPDLTVMHHEPDNLCYPFHHDDLLYKTYSSVTSVKNPQGDQLHANEIRREISTIMKEQIALHAIKTSRAQ